MNEIHNRPLNGISAGRLAIIAIAYWVMVRLGLLLVAESEGIASVWPASGLALAVLLLHPKNQWPKLLAVIFVVNAAGNWRNGNTIPVSLGFALANTMEPFLDAWVLTYFCGSKITFEKIKEVYVLFGTVVIVNSFTASLGAAVPALAFDAPFILSWRLWLAADGLGIILVAPLIVALFSGQIESLSVSRGRLFEVVLLVATIAGFAWLLFGSFTDAEKPVLRIYMVFPLLIWMAFRFRIYGMTAVLLVFGVIAIIHTVHGRGIFAIEGQTVSQRLLALQVSLGVVTYSGLLLTALITGRRQAQEALKASNDFVNNLIGSMQDGISVMGHNGVQLDVNLAFCRMTGFSREELIGARAPYLYWPEEEYEKIQNSFHWTLANEVNDFEAIYKRKNGERFPVLVTPFIIQNDLGEEITYSATVKDNTIRKQAESILRIRLELSQFADSHSLDELLQKTLDSAEVLTGSQVGFAHFLEPDQKTLQLQMWSTNTLKYMCTAEGKGEHYPVDQAGVWVDCVATQSTVIHNDYPSLTHRKGLPEGHAPILRELVTPVLRNGQIVMIMGVGNKPINYSDYDVEVISLLASLAWDIIQRKRSEDALRVSEALLKSTQQLSKVGGWEWDIEKQQMFWTDETYRIHGFSVDEITHGSKEHINRSAACYDPEDRPKILSAFQRCCEQGESYDLKFPFTSAEGRRMWIRTTAQALWEKERIVKVVGNIMDITGQKHAEQALEAANFALQDTLAREKELARTDPLTGINNRRHLIERAGHELDVAMRYRQPLSVILFDIDHFKSINDDFGHAVGDQILRQVTQSARAQLRSADVIGRYGGEEFIILLPMTNPEQAFSLAERIREEVAAFSLSTPKGQACVTLSIGIVELSSADSLEDVFRRADEAMYAAKQDGRNCSRIGRS